jgi:peroxiredoxin Q/BCP
MKMKLKPKDKARDFNLADQDGKKVSLSDFKGRKVLLFFYPKAGTSG